MQAGVVDGVKGAIYAKNSDLLVSDGYRFAAASLKLADHYLEGHTDNLEKWRDQLAGTYYSLEELKGEQRL